MPDEVKPKRRYHSPRRQEQAAATRRAILDAAQRLFEQQGYAATTMEAVAGEAGVALKTVYLVFSTKSGLLRALWDFVLKGDQGDAPVSSLPWYQDVLNERDPDNQLRMNAHNSRVVKQRIAPVLEVIRNAAPVDADSAALWELIQSDFYENQRAIVATLHKRKSLRSGLDVTQAADILWTLNHPDVWQLLVGRRGWAPADYEHWFAETARTQLLKPKRRPQSPH